MNKNLKKTIEQIRKKTQKEAQKIIKDAKDKVEELREEGKKEITRLKDLAKSELTIVKSSFIHTRIDPKLAKKLNDHTQKLGISTSDYVRGLIKDSLSKTSTSKGTTKPKAAAKKPRSTTTKTKKDSSTKK